MFFLIIGEVRMEEKDMLEMLFRGFGKKKQQKVASVRLSHKNEDNEMEVIQRDFEKVNEERIKQGLPPFVNYAEWLLGDKDHFEKNKIRHISEEEKANLCRMAGFEYSPKKDMMLNEER